MKDKFNEEPESLEKCKDFLEFNLLTHYADPIGYDWESSIYQLGDLIGNLQIIRVIELKKNN